MEIYRKHVEQRTNYMRHMDDTEYLDWFVLPCQLSRDSDTLERANWQAQLNMLGGESDTLAILRFGHFLCGWFEFMLLHPSREEEGVSIEAKFEEYCILDEDLLSEIEYKELEDCFGSCIADIFRESFESDILDALDLDSWDDLANSRYQVLDIYDNSILFDLFLRVNGSLHDNTPTVTLDDVLVRRLEHDCPICGNPIAPDMNCLWCDFEYYTPDGYLQYELPFYDEKQSVNEI